MPQLVPASPLSPPASPSPAALAAVADALSRAVRDPASSSAEDMRAILLRLADAVVPLGLALVPVDDPAASPPPADDGAGVSPRSSLTAAAAGSPAGLAALATAGTLAATGPPAAPGTAIAPPPRMTVTERATELRERLGPLPTADPVAVVHWTARVSGDLLMHGLADREQASLMLRLIGDKAWLMTLPDAALASVAALTAAVRARYAAALTPAAVYRQLRELRQAATPVADVRHRLDQLVAALRVLGYQPPPDAQLALVLFEALEPALRSSVRADARYSHASNSLAAIYALAAEREVAVAEAAPPAVVAAAESAATAPPPAEVAALQPSIA